MVRRTPKLVLQTTEFEAVHRCNKGKNVVYLGLVPQPNKATATVYQHRRGHATRKGKFLMLPHATTDLPTIKYCECGCGQPTQLATRNNPARGYVKGQPHRFVLGHHNGRRVYSKADRFTCLWKHLTRGEANECWEWEGHKDKDGYGIASLEGKNVKAHRLSYEVHHGSIDDNMLICHHCDNRACCNPSHLFEGAPVDNSKDMVKKGRSLAGSRHHKAKLKEADILAIRQMLAAAIPYREIAERYQVSKSTIAFIAQGHSWRHVD